MNNMGQADGTLLFQIITYQTRKQLVPVTVIAENFICGLRVGARGLEPPQGAPGKRDLLGASEWPTFFPRSLKTDKLPSYSKLLPFWFQNISRR